MALKNKLEGIKREEHTRVFVAAAILIEREKKTIFEKRMECYKMKKLSPFDSRSHSYRLTHRHQRLSVVF